ncbi:MAG TPA: PQQ-binding-like beta-propeller repeat protein [Thermoanaerobaculia bacterium]|nr:PQQ-binding-like beta-propeller repeat protein [Thermoanaerobaculia bacterium]
MSLLVVTILLTGCRSSAWIMFRYNSLREGTQHLGTDLASPGGVARLQIAASDNIGLTSDPRRFRGSPILFNDRVYIGNANGRFYALNARTLQVDWVYPPPWESALRSQFEFACAGVTFSGNGIASSAAIADVRDPRTGRTERAVLFAAPDPTIAPGYGHGVLFALALEGQDVVRDGIRYRVGRLIRKSDVLARMTGTTPGASGEFHEQLGYSSPLVAFGRIYVGVADHCDNPVQKGRMVVVNESDFTRLRSQEFCSAGTCVDDRQIGGGIWSSVAGFRDSVYITTGNARNGYAAGSPGPTPNHALSMVRINAYTGEMIWKHQPVPYSMDDDPDWASGTTIAATAGCGDVAVSTMKDGYTHAMIVDRSTTPRAAAPVRWVFPPAPLPFRPGDGTVHVDTQYKRPGAMMRDVFVTSTAGWNASSGNLRAGYTRLFGLNVCAPSHEQRIRWIFQPPDSSFTIACRNLALWDGATVYEGVGRNCLGPPTTAGWVGFVGTEGGHLVAFADPIAEGPSAEWICTNPGIPVAQMCTAMNYTVVPVPRVLVDRDLQAGPIMTEPIIVGDSVYVATDGGRVFRLAPR